jgi:adenylyl cyclase-associated protein
VLQAFQAERTFLLVSTKARKPDPPPAELLTDLQVASDEINNIREGNRASPHFQQLSAVAEGTVAMGWVVELRPADMVADTLGAVQFYGNRVLTEYKDK